MTAKAAELLRTTVKVSEALKLVDTEPRHEKDFTASLRKELGSLEKIARGRSTDVKPVGRHSRLHPTAQASKKPPLAKPIASNSRPVAKTTFNNTVTRKKSNSIPTKFEPLKNTGSDTRPTLSNVPRISLTKSDSAVEELKSEMYGQLSPSTGLESTEPWVGNTIYEQGPLERSVSFSTKNPEIQFYENEKKPSLTHQPREFVAGSPPPEPSIAEPHGPIIQFDEVCQELGPNAIEQKRLRSPLSSSIPDSDRNLYRIIELEREILENQRRHDQKVHQLEKILRETTALSKKSSAKDENHIAKVQAENVELQKKNNIYQLELNSFREQNEILRVENKKLLERELSSKRQFASNRLDSYKAANLGAKEKALQDQVVAKLQSIVAKQANNNGIQDSHKLLWNLGYTLSSMVQLCEYLEKPSSHFALGAAQDVTESLEAVLKACVQSCTDYNSQEQSNAALSKEIGKLRETMKHESDHFENEYQNMQNTMQDYEASFNELGNRFESLLQENQHLMANNDELLMDNKRLVSILDELDIPAGLLTNETYSQHQEIQAMQQHINHLQESLANIEIENENLLIIVDELKQDTKNLSPIEEELEDEKLKNAKCAQLIKSLQQQLSVIQNPDFPNIDIHPKDLDSKLSSTLDFNSDLQSNFQILDSEYTKLQQKLVETKAKYNTREQQFLNKIKELKEQLGNEQFEHNVMDRYQQDFKQVKLMMGEDFGSISHPLPFLSVLEKAKSKLDKAMQDSAHFQSQLDQLLSTLKSTEAESEKRECTILEMKKEIGNLNTRLVETTKIQHALESQIKTLEVENEKLTRTAKLVIKHAASFVSNESLL